MDIGAPEIVILLLVVLVIFGGSQVPKLARNLGQAQSEFKKGMSEGAAEATKDVSSATAVEAASTLPPPSAPR